MKTQSLAVLFLSLIGACAPRESTRDQQERWHNAGRIDAMESVYLEKMAKQKTGGDIGQQ